MNRIDLNNADALRVIVIEYTGCRIGDATRRLIGYGSWLSHFYTYKLFNFLFQISSYYDRLANTSKYLLSIIFLQIQKTASKVSQII